MAEKKRYWTKERLEALDHNDPQFPLELGRFRLRSSTKESRLQWKTRALMMIEEGKINLEAGRKTSKDFYLKRPPYVIEGLSCFGIRQEDQQRALTQEPRTPLLNDFINDSEARQIEAAQVPKGVDDVMARFMRSTDSSALFDVGERHGLARVRDLMAEWVEDTYQRKFEEAHCNLNCSVCPSANALACITENVTPLVFDGYDVEIELGIKKKGE